MSSILLDALDWIASRVRPVVNSPAGGAWLQPYGQATAVVIEDGHELTPLPVGPTSQPRRSHTLVTVVDYAAYLRRHFMPQATEILADQSRDAIVAYSGQMWHADRVTCALPKSSAFTAWTRKFGAKLGQKDLYRFLLSHRDEFEGASQILGGLRALEIIKSDTMKGNLTEQGVYEFIGASQGTDIRGSLPTRLDVRIPIYQGSRIFHLDVDIVIDTSGPAPAFSLEPIALDDTLDQAWNHEVETLQALLGPPVVGGDPNTPGTRGFLVSRGKGAMEWAPVPEGATIG